MVMIREKKVKVGTFLPVDLNARLDKHCDEVERNKNVIIARALELYLSTEEAKNGSIKKANGSD